MPGQLIVFDGSNGKQALSYPPGSWAKESEENKKDTKNVKDRWSMVASESGVSRQRTSPPLSARILAAVHAPVPPRSADHFLRNRQPSDVRRTRSGVELRPRAGVVPARAAQLGAPL